MAHGLFPCMYSIFDHECLSRGVIRMPIQSNFYPPIMLPPIMSPLIMFPSILFLPIMESEIKITSTFF